MKAKLARARNFLRAAFLGLSVAGRMAFAAETTPLIPHSVPSFSEDFESGRLSSEVWAREVTGGNSVEVQSDCVAHGKFALRLRCPAGSEKTWAFITASHLPPALQHHHFGRAYMFVTPKPPDRHIILLTAGTPGFPRNKYLEVATAHAKWQLTYVDLQGKASTEDYYSAGAVPTGRWFCLEWEFNDQPDHAAIWVDGDLVLATNFVSKVTGGRTGLVGAFTDLALGFRLWGAAPEAFDLYYDDIALGTQRLGPLPPDEKHKK